jgi:hypothetical protein
MNIVILNGNPDAEKNRFDGFLRDYQLKLHKTGHYVRTFQLRDMRIAGPEDDMRYIIASLKEADLLIWASPVKQGLLTMLTRTVQCRVNQYFQNNLTIHANPWMNTETVNKVPLIGVILQPEPDITEQEMLLIRLTQERMAANLQTVMSFLITTEMELIEAVCKTFRSFDYRLYIENTCNDFIDGPALKFGTN